MFDLKGKNAIVTGGANGIGFQCCNELLKMGVKKCAILDLNPDLGSEAAKKLSSQYGNDCALYVKCDVSKMDEFEKAIKMALGCMKSCDIIVNNAGIFNESIWETEIQINLIGAIHGVMLGMKYMGKNNGGQGGAIVNMASIMGVDTVACCPIYSATKHGIIGMTKSYGLPFYYDKTGIRMMAMCPGVTVTDLVVNIAKCNPNEEMTQQCEKDLKDFTTQEPSKVAEGVVHMLQYGDSGSLWVCEGGELYELDIPERFNMRKNK